MGARRRAGGLESGSEKLRPASSCRGIRPYTIKEEAASSCEPLIVCGVGRFGGGTCSARRRRSTQHAVNDGLGRSGFLAEAPSATV